MANRYGVQIPRMPSNLPFGALVGGAGALAALGGAAYTTYSSVRASSPLRSASASSPACALGGGARSQWRPSGGAAPHPSPRVPARARSHFGERLDDDKAEGALTHRDAVRLVDDEAREHAGRVQAPQRRQHPL